MLDLVVWLALSRCSRDAGYTYRMLVSEATAVCALSSRKLWDEIHNWTILANVSDDVTTTLLVDVVMEIVDVFGVTIVGWGSAMVTTILNQRRSPNCVQRLVKHVYDELRVLSTRAGGIQDMMWRVCVTKSAERQMLHKHLTQEVYFFYLLYK